MDVKKRGFLSFIFIHLYILLYIFLHSESREGLKTQLLKGEGNGWTGIKKRRRKERKLIKKISPPFLDPDWPVCKYGNLAAILIVHAKKEK